MAKKITERKVDEDPRYHDTWRLLKKYRDVVWSLELSVQQLRKQFAAEYGSNIEDFLESIYLAGAVCSPPSSRQKFRTPAMLLPNASP